MRGWGWEKLHHPDYLTRVLHRWREALATGEPWDYLLHQGAYADQEKYPLPFVIFMDLKLPYLDGFEVLSWIRAQPALQSIVVVVLSGSDETRDHQKAYALGARTYLVKPPQAKDILLFVDSMASCWGSPGGTCPC